MEGGEDELAPEAVGGGEHEKVTGRDGHGGVEGGSDLRSHLDDGRRVEERAREQQQRVLRARAVILATGAAPRQPPAALVGALFLVNFVFFEKRAGQK